MTNEMIIENNRMALIEAGIINQNEAIHTYEAWKQAGYQVKRGEKAVARFSIWKKGKKETTVEVPTESGEKVEKLIDTGNFFRKDACFFSSRQVEKASKKPA